jgi:hypothetical protein
MTLRAPQGDLIIKNALWLATGHAAALEACAMGDAMSLKCNRNV